MSRQKPLTLLLLASAAVAHAQTIDRTLAPNPINEGIAKSLTDQIGAGRGDLLTPGSSAYIIARDPFRAIRRGRNIFQRKFFVLDGGDYLRDGTGDIVKHNMIGAGLADSCATCHSRPRGSAGFGGSVVTRPDSRDAPHLFGLGLKEMLADEITADLRQIRTEAVVQARKSGGRTTLPLVSKGIGFGLIAATPDGAIDTSSVEGVDPDLRVRPFFHHGGTISIREFVIGALHAEMGMQGSDPELSAIHKQKGRCTSPAGMVFDTRTDEIELPPDPDKPYNSSSTTPRNQIPTALIDYLEFYLLNYFKPAVYEQTRETKHGRFLFERIGCAKCHIPDLEIRHDRRVADVETVFDLVHGGFNRLFATARPLFTEVHDSPAHPSIKRPLLQPFVVRNIFTDFKRHDLGPQFHERNYDGSVQKQFITTPLWGVGTTAPYGHDGRSVNLTEVILRHGGEAQPQRDQFAMLSSEQRSTLLEFLNSLVLFPPDDTASNLDPVDRSAATYPLTRHGSIRLSALFNDPRDPE